MARQRSRGFTLLEMMTAITVLAVLLAGGVPTFIDLIRRNRVAVQTNDLLSSLAVARSEALKRGKPVAICGSDAAQAACSGSADWSRGWIVFSDEGAEPGVLEDTETVVQRSPAAGDGTVVQTGGAAFVRYGPDGSVLISSDPIVFRVFPMHCSAALARSVTVTLVGRGGSAPADCP